MKNRNLINKSRNVIARNEMTKQSSLLSVKRDCFASLAMTKSLLSPCLILILILMLFSQPSQADGFGGFEMTIEQDCIYTPGRLKLTMQLNQELEIETNYQFRVSIYTAGTLIRQQSLDISKGEPVVFSLEFPEVQTKTNGRCKCELFIGEQFIRSEEKPITLWPPISPYPDESIKEKTIWTYDISGKLNEIFEKMELKFSDATFQTVRDFGEPNIVFFGQGLDPNNISAITGRIESLEPKPMVIWLQQKYLPYSSKIEIPMKNNIAANVQFDKNSPLLVGLNTFDIMSLVEGCSYVKIQNDEIIVKSALTEKTKDEKYTNSYLCTTEEGSIQTIYCQLPVTERDDPRGVLLLTNLLKYADKKTR